MHRKLPETATSKLSSSSKKTDARYIDFRTLEPFISPTAGDRSPLTMRLEVNEVQLAITKKLYTWAMNKGAIISPCGKYRYQLWRIWDDRKPLCMFVMHNPSTADANIDDPTIRRCIGFAASWGHGGIYIGNLSPYRATNPKDMIGLNFSDLCPIINMYHTNEMVKKCHLHVFAYGNPIISSLKPEIWDEHWHYLKLTKDGNPCHPLYLKKDLQPIKFQSK